MAADIVPKQGQSKVLRTTHYQYHDSQSFHCTSSYHDASDECTANARHESHQFQESEMVITVVVQELLCKVIINLISWLCTLPSRLMEYEMP
jgi:hypothetical protein